jgi:tRNA A-37 threonylcarbamoyl transferase component Bud32
VERIIAMRRRFEAAWTAGERPAIEDYLGEVSGPERALALRELLALELARRHAAGERPLLDEYLARFPSHQTLVRTVFLATTPTVTQTLPRPGAKLCEAASTDNARRDPTPVQTPPPTGSNEGGREASTPPPRLPGFEFHALLGRGGHGEVWLATDVHLRQPRAIKLLRRERYSAVNLERLKDEAGKMARLPKHRNYVQVHGLIPADGNWFLVMEYVSGGPLSDRTIPDSPLPWQLAARYVADVAEGLAEVHAHGILHRDVKPANILWDSQRDEALLADFGIAAYADQALGIAGTVGYLAPELLTARASAGSDVFALAATLYHLLAGEAPFDTSSLMISLYQARVGVRPPLPAGAALPRAMEEVIAAGLAPDPDERIDLATFTARLRGAHLQALADRLLELSRRSAARVGLRVAVLTAGEADLRFRPVPCEAPAEGEAPRAVVRTGDLLRLEATAEADGYLTILNLGSSGELKVLFPNPLARDNRIGAGQTQRLTVKLAPPPGTDRAALIWTRRPTTLTPADWRARLEAGQPASAPPRASIRGMDFVLQEALELPDDAWAAFVVTVTHRVS